MKWKRTVALTLSLCLIVGLLAGCALFQSAEAVYSTYSTAMRDATAYTYDMSLSASADVENIKSLEAFADSDFEALSLSITANGVYNQPGEQLSSHLGVDLTYDTISYTTKDFTDVALDGSDLYVNGEAAYDSIVSVLKNMNMDSLEEYPLEQPYVYVDLKELTEMDIWDTAEDAGNKDEQPEFAKALSSYMSDYVKANGEFAKGKNQAGVQLESVDLKGFMDGCIDIVIENRDSLADYVESTVDDMEDAATDTVPVSVDEEEVESGLDEIRSMTREDIQEELDELYTYIEDNRLSANFTSVVTKVKTSSGFMSVVNPGESAYERRVSLTLTQLDETDSSKYQTLVSITMVNTINLGGALDITVPSDYVNLLEMDSVEIDPITVTGDDEDSWYEDDYITDDSAFEFSSYEDDDTDDRVPGEADPSVLENLQPSGTIEGWDVTVVGAEFVEPDILRVAYDATNNTDHANYVRNAVYVTVEQDGYRCDFSYADVSEDDPYYGNDWLNIMPGLTIRCTAYYQVSSSGGPVSLLMNDYVSTENYVGMVLDLNNLSGISEDYEIPTDYAFALEDGTPDTYEDTNCRIQILDAEMGTDSLGDDCVLVSFQFENLTEETTSMFMMTPFVSILQDGVELPGAYLNDENMTMYDNVEGGSSSMVFDAHSLRTDSPLLVLMSDWDGTVLAAKIVELQ